MTRSSVYLGTAGTKYDLFQVDENSVEDSISQASAFRSCQMETHDMTPSGSAMGGSIAKMASNGAVIILD